MLNKMKKIAISAIAVGTISSNSNAMVVTVDNFPFLQALQQALLQQMLQYFHDLWNSQVFNRISQIVSQIEHNSQWCSINPNFPGCNQSTAPLPTSQTDETVTTENQYGDTDDPYDNSGQLSGGGWSSGGWSSGGGGGGGGRPKKYTNKWQYVINCENNPSTPGCAPILNSSRSPIADYIYGNKKNLAFKQYDLQTMHDVIYKQDVDAVSSVLNAPNFDDTVDFDKDLENKIKQIDVINGKTMAGLNTENRIEPMPSKEFFKNMTKKQEAIYTYLSNKQLQSDEYIDALYNRLKTHYQIINQLRKDVKEACKSITNTNFGGVEATTATAPLLCLQLRVQLHNSEIELERMEIEIAQLRYSASISLDRAYDRLINKK